MQGSGPKFWKKIFKDTNAQENLGRQFQFSNRKPRGSKISLQEALEHAWKFITTFQFDRKSVLGGVPTSYGQFGDIDQKKKKKRKKTLK
jgi:hypothetical protein